MAGNITNEKEAKDEINGKLARYFGAAPKEATPEQLYKAVVMVVRDILLEKRQTYHKKVRSKRAKRVYYLCIEFFLGRWLRNNLYNLILSQVFDKAVSSYNVKLEDLYEFEPDPGLGNGGLGRLAACFMDSLATGNYPAMGYSLRYEYGLFKQKIVDGWQTELPDVWLPGGEAWLTQRTDKEFTVRFGGKIEETWTRNGMVIEYRDCQEIKAVAYDMMISGKGSEAVSVLRLWKAKPVTDFNMKLFSQGEYYQALEDDNDAELLTKVLYPTDNHTAGKSLRLKQQYFLCSASIQNIVDDHKHRYGDLRDLPKLAAIHLNDTHPAMAIPELMRILVDEYYLEWDVAWAITTGTCSYTNHTVLSEALETWSEDLVARTVPRIHSIIKEINRRMCDRLWNRFPGEWGKISNMAIIEHDRIKMANLSVYGSHNVNGVSALHSDIIKKTIFKDFHDYSPEKFSNVTNGIVHRRWLCQANPELCSLLDDCIGTGYDLSPERLEDFKKYADDTSVLKRLDEIKYTKKKQLADYALKEKNVKLNPDMVFDVQAKRLHEYKRQLLNVLNIIDQYLDLLDNPDKDMVPKTYIFGAKAAPGYDMAKSIIKLICYLGEEINNNPKVNQKLNVAFLEEYNVTMSEKLMPATEISEQISLAGKEASGTGNMKFMINGALTIGTLDGANVEMAEAVGDDNIFICGYKSDEVEEIWNSGYSSMKYYNESPKLRRIIEALIVGFNHESFANIADYLLRGSGVADPYMCMADFTDYNRKQIEMSNLYRDDKMAWNRKSLMNIASAGRFSADRAIKDYADTVWNLKPLK